MRLARRQIPPHQLPDELTPLLRRLYAARGVTCAEDLELGLARLLDFRALKGISEATALLHEVIAGQGRILVVGDFDADGATACALAVSGLRRFDAVHVDTLIPDRVRHGYGLSPAIAAEAAARQPDLLVTVDNGIASVQGVALAKAAGIKVLITDHHLPGAVLPAADAIVNPNQPGCSFPSRCLAGVGVLFYVLLALRARMREAGAFAAGAEPALADDLDLVAIGTVADVVPLDHNNRILVEQGLKRIRAGRARPGVYALAQVAGCDPARLCAADIGYYLAPRLNAAGRLDDMSLGVACLLARDEASAMAAALRLHALNAERRALQAEMQDAALAAVAAAEAELDGALPAGLCVFREDWHEGIVGLVAGKVREHHHRPAVAFAPAGEAGWLKGSARSLPGLHIRDVLDAIATANPGLIERFGGHAAAAGLTLASANLEAFKAAFADAAGRALTAELLAGHLETDGELAAQEFDLEVARALRLAGPWGAAFPEPCFDGEFEVLEQRIVGERHLKLRLRPVGIDKTLEAIAFGHERRLAEATAHRLVYRLEPNQFRGLESLQLVVTQVVAAG